MTEQAPADDPVTAAIAATVGNGIDEATAERIARLARYLLDDDPALSMRLGPYKLDAPRAAVKAAVTAAALAIAIEGAGLDSVPVVVLASVVPFLVEIERVELTPGDELVVAALRATALPGGDDHDWYRTASSPARSGRPAQLGSERVENFLAYHLAALPGTWRHGARNRSGCLRLCQMHAVVLAGA